MQWIAPSEKDTATNTLEKRLWEAADQLRANSGLTAAQYSSPVLGLIFLRFAEAKRVLLHQPREGGSGPVEMHFLDPPRLLRVDPQQPLDIGAHAFVDEVEQPARRRVQAVVEVENPIADMGEARVHQPMER